MAWSRKRLRTNSGKINQVTKHGGAKLNNAGKQPGGKHIGRMNGEIAAEWKISRRIKKEQEEKEEKEKKMIKKRKAGLVKKNGDRK